jgi:tetratricopeptide (TPR) repeat protein
MTDELKNLRHTPSATWLAEAMSLPEGRRRLRYALCTLRSALFAMLFALCAMLLLYYLHLRLMSGINHLAGNNYVSEGYYGLAVDRLTAAIAYRPSAYEIKKALGDVYYDQSVLNKTAQEAFSLSHRSRDLYLSAKDINPLDAEAAYGAARAEFRLEQLHAYMHTGKGNSPYNALPWFREAIRLRPNSVTFRYAMAQYLHFHDSEDLLTVVRDLAMVYPNSYYNLRKDKFWSPTVREEVKIGLEQAIKEDSSSKEAHKAMSSLFADEDRWDEALSHYILALEYRTYENTPADHIQLGYLYLKTGDLEAAEKGFMTGLGRSMSRDSDLARIYQYYKAAGLWDGFSTFYDRVRQRSMTTTRMDIIFSQALIEQKEYDHAREILMEVNKGGGNAEACYWLARIAENEHDWDSMELLIQKATVLSPRDSNYHLVFSNLLRRLKKLERAEKEATLALQYETRPSPWTYNHRASIRWALKDYEGAVQDWRAAISLRPDYAPFYAQAGEAYAQLAYWPIAVEYYKKALSLDPNNEGYKKKYKELSSY